MRNFVTAAVERAVKTLAQVLLTFFVAGQTDFLDVGWGKALGVAGLAALASVLTSVVSYPLGPGDSPSVTHER